MQSKLIEYLAVLVIDVNVNILFQTVDKYLFATTTCTSTSFRPH